MIDKDRLLVTIILAAGKGKRMKSFLPKALVKLSGRPLVHHVIDLAHSIGSQRILMVAGHCREMVIGATSQTGIEHVIQENQLGTGDAVMACRSKLDGYHGDILILSGDVPMLRPLTVASAYEIHRSSDSAATVFTFKPDNPNKYGRIIRGDDNELLDIVEAKDASADQLRIPEVNGGVYFFKADLLFKALNGISNDNASREYYLTDTIRVFSRWGERQAVFLVDDPVELSGINSQDELIELERKYMKQRALKS